MMTPLFRLSKRFDHLSRNFLRSASPTLNRTNIKLNLLFVQATLEYPRLERQRALLALAAGQRGYFTTGQARGLGYAYQTRQHHREAGNWLTVSGLRGVYRLRDYPDDRLERLVQLNLWSANERIGGVFAWRIVTEPGSSDRPSSLRVRLV